VILIWGLAAPYFLALPGISFPERVSLCLGLQKKWSDPSRWDPGSGRWKAALCLRSSHVKGVPSAGPPRTVPIPGWSGIYDQAPVLHRGKETAGPHWASSRCWMLSTRETTVTDSLFRQHLPCSCTSHVFTIDGTNRDSLEGIRGRRDLRWSKTCKTATQKMDTSNVAPFLLCFPPFSDQLLLSHNLCSHTESEEERIWLFWACFFHPHTLHDTQNNRNELSFFLLLRSWRVSAPWMPSSIFYTISKSSPNALFWKTTLKLAIIYAAFPSGAKLSKHSPLGCPTKHFSRGHFPSIQDRRAGMGFACSQLTRSCGIAQKQQGGGLPPDNWADNFEVL